MLYNGSVWSTVWSQKPSLVEQEGKSQKPLYLGQAGSETPSPSVKVHKSKRGAGRQKTGTRKGQDQVGKS